MKNGKNVLLKINYFILALYLNFNFLNVYAEDEPLAVINNLNELIYKGIAGIGLIIAGISGAQFFMSVRGQDSTTKYSSLIGFVGGLMMVFLKGIISEIVGG